MRRLFKIFLVLLLLITSLTPVFHIPIAIKQANAETCVYYTYDPELGRFISRDPVRGPLTVPQSLNPYAYALNNPVNLSDPSGENPILQKCIEIGSKLVTKWPSQFDAPKVINGITYTKEALIRMEPVGFGGEVCRRQW